jgi:SSS family solute:Na+ symporter
MTPADIVFLAAAAGLPLAALFAATLRCPGADGFFLAGRGLSWWLVAASAVAAGFSGLSSLPGIPGGEAGFPGGPAALLAPAALVWAALGFLPFFLRRGVATVPQFLGERFGRGCAFALAGAALCLHLLMLGSLGPVAASSLGILAEGAGAKLSPAALLALPLGIAAASALWRGLRSCAWLDAAVACAVIAAVGWAVFAAVSASGGGLPGTFGGWRERVRLPAGPGWGEFSFGLWVPLLYAWGCNQAAVQRSLGAASLRQGQLGLVAAAACLALLLPAFLAARGIAGIPGHPGGEFASAALTAILATSAMAALIHASATLLALDCFKGFAAPGASERFVMVQARGAVVFVVAAAASGWLAAGNPDAVAAFSRRGLAELFPVAAPAFVALFAVASVIRRAPRVCGIIGLAVAVAAAVGLRLLVPGMGVPLRMLAAFGAALFAMLAITFVKPLDKAVHLPLATPVDLKPSPAARRLAWAVLVLVALAAFLFRPF